MEYTKIFFFFFLSLFLSLSLSLFFFFFLAAITITGHDTPIIVGLSGVINCTTILNASKLEWRLVGIGAGEPVEETSWEKFLALTLTPEATELNGAKLTCRVTTAKQSVFEKTVTVTIKGRS